MHLSLYIYLFNSQTGYKIFWFNQAKVMQDYDKLD